MYKSKNIRIALVEAGASSTHVYSKTYLPRVGIPTIGAVLKKMGYECDVWFQSMKGFKAERLKQYDVVGIGSLSGQIFEAYHMADSLRKAGVLVAMGGPHVTFMPEEALDHCDYVILGEGEVSFPALIETLEGKREPDSVPGLVYRKKSGDMHFTQGLTEKIDFTDLPSPDFSLSPQFSSKRMPAIVSTSRGCPHSCTFCTVTAVFGKSYRFKTNEQVISELRPILDRSVCFADDNFCAKPARTKALLSEMIVKKAVPLRWAGQMTVGVADDAELLDLMQKTRCRTVYVGIESIVAETLKSFHKSHNLDTIGRCIENLHKHDIGVHGMFVVGIDDTVESVEKIIDFAIERDIETIQVMGLTPFPGTGAFDEYKDQLLHHEWNYYTGMCVVFRPRNCSAYDLQMAIMRGMRKFYSLKRVVGSYRRGRGWRVKYRAGANYIVRKWFKQNEAYIERLRTQF